MILLRIHLLKLLRRMLASGCCVLASGFAHAGEGMPGQSTSTHCTDAMAIKHLCIKSGISLWNSGADTTSNTALDNHTLQSVRREQSRSLLKDKLGRKLKWRMGRGFEFGHQTYVKDYGDKGRALGISRQMDDYSVNLTVTDPGVSVRKRIKSLTFDARLATQDEVNGDTAPFAFFGVAGSWR